MRPQPHAIQSRTRVSENLCRLSPRLRPNRQRYADRRETEQARRVEDVRACLLEGLEPGDSVVEVGPAMQRNFGSCGESEAEGKLARRLDRGLDALGRFSGMVDRCVTITGRILDRGADKIDRGRPADVVSAKLSGR